MSLELNESVLGEIKLMFQERETLALFLDCGKENHKKKKKTIAKKEEIVNRKNLEKRDTPLQEKSRVV